MPVSTTVVKLFLQDESLMHMLLDSSLRLQVLSDISALSGCQKRQFAAFVRIDNILIVWDDDLNYILKCLQPIEDQSITMVWKDETDDDESAPPALVQRRPAPSTSMHSMPMVAP
jgi:hypothetical protein